MQEAEFTDREVLEALYAAKDSLADPGQRYEYQDWTVCGCGHIYIGAAGRRAANPDRVTEPPAGSLYQTVITRVATVLGWHEQDPDATAVGFVSDMVGHKGKMRFAAKRVVQDAIDEIEAAEQAAMLQIADPAHEAPLA